MKIGRRSFVHSTLTAAGSLLVPGRALWAQGGAPGSIPAGLQALSSSGKPVSLTAADLKGRLFLSQDQGYDEARKYWDSAFDRHPALIVLPANTDDVIKAVQFARSHDLLTAVRAGGHCQVEKATACDGGLMINLSLMREAQIDL